MAHGVSSFQVHAKIAILYNSGVVLFQQVPNILILFALMVIFIAR